MHSQFKFCYFVGAYPPYMAHSLFRRKSVASVMDPSGETDPKGLKRVLNVRDLTSMGVAAVIGAGIFSTIGQAAYNGGPGVVFLFVIIAVTCGFTALCYAEFAARVPVAGSAYTYSYVSIGELVAWIIGWALIMEYAIGNVVVSISWSSYFVNLIEGLGIGFPAWLATDYKTAKTLFDTAVSSGASTEGLAWTSAPVIAGWKIFLNVPAFVIVILITILAYIGISESRNSANFMVGLKLVVLTAVVLIGIFYIDTDNWTPFMPNQFTGVLKGVSAIFFAYIGFDAISTTAEECANPQRDLPRGMIYSLLICTGVYVVVTLVITGMVSYAEFNNVADPLAYVFEKINLPRIGYIVSVSAVVAATSVLLVFQLGQPRIWMSMSRDGLLPKRFSKIHPRFHTPSFATIVTGFFVGIPALFVDISIVTDLTSIGTLFAFVLVCGGVLNLPKIERAPGNKRFSLPYINGRWIVPILFVFFIYGYSDRIIEAWHHPVTDILFVIFMIAATVITGFTVMRNLSLIPILGMTSCLYLMVEIPAKSWLVFFGWMAIGLVIYFLYGYRKSHLRNATQ
jgi:APA family basic amino acid/polyamine antiporter